MKLKALIAVCAVLSIGAAQAADGAAAAASAKKVSIQINGGYSMGFSGTTGTGIGLSYGAKLGYKVMDNKLELGAEWMLSYGGTTTVPIVGTSVSTGLSGYNVYGNYFLIEGLYAGAHVGYTTLSTTTTLLILPITVASSAISFGAQVGYQLMLGEKVSLTPEVGFTYSLAGSGTLVMPSMMFATGLVRLGFHF